VKYESEIGKGFNRWSEGQYTEGQEKALSNFSDLFILNSGSYRSGKTEILCRAGIRHILTFQGAKLGVFRAHLASLKKSTLLTFLQLIHPSWVKSWSNTDLVMELINGSKVSFIGADFPDRLGSIELTMALIDEAAEVSEEAITMIQGRLSGHLERPTNYGGLPSNLREYVDATLGIRQTWLACNPKSSNHPLYKTYIKDQKPGHKIYSSNSLANVNLPENYLVQNLAAYVRDGFDIAWVRDQVRAIRSGEAPADGLHLKDYLNPLGQRNLLGLWVALEGAVYNLDEARHLLGKVPEGWLDSGKCFAGVDFGFHNPRVIVAKRYQAPSELGFKTAYAAVDYWRGKEATGEDLLNALRALVDRWAIETLVLPHDRPDLFKLARNEFGSNSLRKAKTNVLSGILTTSEFINSGRLIFLKTTDDPEAPNNHALAWEEMTGYEWGKDKNGNYQDEPVKKNDHYPDALRYLVHTLENRRRGLADE